MHLQCGYNKDIISKYFRMLHFAVTNQHNSIDSNIII